MGLLFALRITSAVPACRTVAVSMDGALAVVLAGFHNALFGVHPGTHRDTNPGADPGRAGPSRDQSGVGLV